MKAPTRCILIYRFVLASIGIVVGLSAGLVFGSHFRNFDACIWGILSGLSATLSALLHTLYTSGYLVKISHHLPSVSLAGCFIQLAGVCGFTAYIVLAIGQGQGLSPYGRSYYIASVWTFMTWKWGFLLLYYSRSYRRYFDYLSSRPLCTNTSHHPAEATEKTHLVA